MTSVDYERVFKDITIQMRRGEKAHVLEEAIEGFIARMETQTSFLMVDSCERFKLAIKEFRDASAQ